MRLVAMCVDDRATYKSAEMARVTDAVLAVNHDQVEDEEYDHDGTPQNGPLDRLVVQKHVRTEEAEDAVAGSARTNHHQAAIRVHVGGQEVATDATDEGNCEDAPSTVFPL